MTIIGIHVKLGDEALLQMKDNYELLLPVTERLKISLLFCQFCFGKY